MAEALDIFKQYEHFCKSMLDAYAVVDRTGKVVKFNQLFSALVATRPNRIKKSESFDDLLTLDMNQEPLKIIDLLEKNSPTRLDEIHGQSNENDHLNLIIGVYPLISDDETVGVFLLLRDVTAETNLQDKYKDRSSAAVTDKLTGLYNRTYFEEHLPKILERVIAEPGQDQISVIMADIDHFKKVNDTHGHQAGDFIIREVSRIFRENFRKSDIAFRYGGEEFLAILPAATAADAARMAEKVRHAAEAVYVFNDISIPITVSLGVAQLQVEKESAEEAIARADSALYHSKQNGRNLVSIHHGDGSHICANEEEADNLGVSA
ncbi:MAG: GGDEF domain-containing protein [Oligoflexales bacterium]